MMYDWLLQLVWVLDRYGFWIGMGFGSVWVGIGVQGVGFHRLTVLRPLGFANCPLAWRWGVCSAQGVLQPCA
jgi:hypothetical protein